MKHKYSISGTQVVPEISTLEKRKAIKTDRHQFVSFFILDLVVQFYG